MLMIIISFHLWPMHAHALTHLDSNATCVCLASRIFVACRVGSRNIGCDDIATVARLFQYSRMVWHQLIADQIDSAFGERWTRRKCPCLEEGR